MKLGRTKRSILIRRFLLNAVKAGSQLMIPDAVETFGVSRQTIHKHLSELVKMGYLEAHGNTRSRTYALGSIRSHKATLVLKGLEESEVYLHEFGHVFKGLPKNIEEICHYGFTEMLNNAIDHSEGTQVSIEVERDQSTIALVIADNGEGIFARIARLLGLGDPRESILELSKGKLTTDPDNHTGQGIFFTSRAFEKFAIFSGDLVFSHTGGEDLDYLYHDEESRSGTAALMAIGLASQNDLKLVFETYSGSEDDDYAFNTTVVPVKLVLYEGEQLVSRSQAKRILNRVERFKYVQLDYNDVDFIGQAFADEVYRVFARKHPEIALETIHANHEVTKAIVRARAVD